MTTINGKAKSIQEAIDEANNLYNPKAPRNDRVLVIEGSKHHFCHFVGSEVIDGKVTLKMVIDETVQTAPRKSKKATEVAKPQKQGR